MGILWSTVEEIFFMIIIIILKNVSCFRYKIYFF